MTILFTQLLGSGMSGDGFLNIGLTYKKNAGKLSHKIIECHNSVIVDNCRSNLYCTNTNTK